MNNLLIYALDDTSGVCGAEPNTVQVCPLLVKMVYYNTVLEV